MKKGYTIFELNNLEFFTGILRACPQITFQTANLINKNNINITTIIKEYRAEAILLSERQKEAMLLTGTEKDETLSTIQEQIKMINDQKREVEVVELSSSLFSDIVGDKEYGQEGKKFSYREAYFGLLGEIITE